MIKFVGQNTPISTFRREKWKLGFFLYVIPKNGGGQIEYNV
jgi:hypothetical protein